MRSLKLLSMSVAAVVALTATSAFAQRDAGAKMRGEFGIGFHNSVDACSSCAGGSPVSTGPNGSESVLR
jgi:hypothetical protein